MEQIYTTVRRFINDALDKFDLNMWELHIKNKDNPYRLGKISSVEVENTILSQLEAPDAFHSLTVMTFEDSGTIFVTSTLMEESSLKISDGGGNDMNAELEKVLQEFLKNPVFHTVAKDGPLYNAHRT